MNIWTSKAKARLRALGLVDELGVWGMSLGFTAHAIPCHNPKLTRASHWGGAADHKDKKLPYNSLYSSSNETIQDPRSFKPKKPTPEQLQHHPWSLVNRN